MITADVSIVTQFYDIDPMLVVWHGNYPRFLEAARSALFDRIGYGYAAMAASGYAYPIIDMRLRYVGALRLAQKIHVRATLTEYTNRISIAYVIRDDASDKITTKASTVQVAVQVATGEMCFVTPAALTDKVRAFQCPE